MSKHWNPPSHSAKLKPSRIRRDPVRLTGAVPAAPKKRAHSNEREMWFGMTGVVLFASAIAVVVVGISVATFTKDDPGAATRAGRFGQCYDSDGPNCVLDGNTIYVKGARVEIAGIEAPRIQGSACADERTRGIDAAVRLADRLNSGQVTLGAPFRDPSGRAIRTVAVDGSDLGERMIAAGLAHRAGDPRGWCG
jgi:endonuclease YncB( thermonuclease family)